MMTLIARLCGLCAVSTLIQMALLAETNSCASLRMINGLLMLHLTLSSASDLLSGLISAGSFEMALAYLMK